MLTCVLDMFSRPSILVTLRNPATVPTMLSSCMPLFNVITSPGVTSGNGRVSCA